MSRSPDLCVIVLSYRNEHTIVRAVDSLLGQEAPLEVVVSHSGGGPTAGLLEGKDVRLTASPGRRTPGAARNAGVSASRAPLVAFLAGDCAAMPGWAAGRRRRHRAGAPAVASSMATMDRCATSVASHLLQHSSRLPHLAMAPHLRFGVSYTRELLDRHGPFPELMRSEEDVALNGRLIAAGVEIEWAPEVVTAHSYPASVRELLYDQFRRGRLRLEARCALRRRPALAARALLDAPAGAWRASRPGAGFTPAELMRSGPLLALGSLATAAGTTLGTRA